MKTKYILIPLILIWALSCNPPAEEQDTAQSSSDSINLEGSWKLTSYFDSQDSSWKEYPDHIIYEKHITPTHFTWIKFNTKANKLEGAGGGTYTFNGNTYTEDIHFFFPPGSNELGQAIPFTVKMEDGKWHHTGYSKIMEFDPEKGEMVAVDSSKIDEYWVKTDADKAENEMLTGTWELASYKNDGDSIWIEYPKFVKYEKHITPTHFTWIKYNGEGDEVMALGGGTYDTKENKYIEHVKFYYPSDHDVLGQTIPFNVKMEDGKWEHTGYYDEKDNQQEETDDSVKIEEIWVRYGNGESKASAEQNSPNNESE